MKEKKEASFEELLSKVKAEQAELFLQVHKDILLHGDIRDFKTFMKEYFDFHKVNRSLIFSKCGLSDKYGYSIIYGDKHTSKRDYIISICFLAGMRKEECNIALELYGMNRLMPRVKRDALIIVAFHDCDRRDLSEINDLLTASGENSLEQSNNL